MLDWLRRLFRRKPASPAGTGITEDSVRSFGKRRVLALEDGACAMVLHEGDRGEIVFTKSDGTREQEFT